MSVGSRPFVALGVVVSSLLATPVASEELADPTGSSNVLLRLDPSGGTVGLQLPVGSTVVWGAAGFDHRLLGVSLVGGGRYRLVDGPKYRLDAWAEVRPEVLFNGRTAFTGSAEIGLRHLFGRRPVRWSAGVGVDSAAALSPASAPRLRPEANLGLGLESPTSGWRPDGAWLRGALGYDFLPDQLGAIHADLWLALHWRLGEPN